jgi:hypothetical protein
MLPPQVHQQLKMHLGESHPTDFQVSISTSFVNVNLCQIEEQKLLVI